jgi:Tol biopolymer transport system component
VVFQAEGDQNAEQLLNPTYSRSGTRVAFTRILFGQNSETDEIWVMNADGSNPTRLTTGNNDDKATWSPNDQWIAFERNQSPAAIIAVVSSSGGSVTRLAEGMGPA